MVPEPTVCFTIPSVHDDTTLECRIYHPSPSCGRSGPGDERPWRPRGAIIAHPYATLGGCYDDFVVLSTVAEVLQEGFVVGTFNFRGAGSSKGRTSWSASPEILDYVSFAGFFVYYVTRLNGATSSDSSRNDSGTTLSPIPSTQIAPCDTLETINSQGMILILGGYSYGSLIVTLLPDTMSILNRFSKANTGSAEAEIKLRALHLSTQWNRDVLMRGRSQRNKTSRSHGNAMIVGGEESDPGTRGQSRDSRRSIDTIRRSLDISKRKLGLRPTGSGEPEAPLLDPTLCPDEVPLPKTFYLLISPLRPPISSFMTIFSKARHRSVNLEGHNTPDADSNLTAKPTLAVYGDEDFFTSQKRLRKWVEDLAGKPSSSFQFREIAGAGHFWQEEGAEVQLRTSIRFWVWNVLNQ